MDAEMWRWAIGGGLAALTGGVGWLLLLVWRAGQALARIEATLASQAAELSRQSARLDAHDVRLREVEAACARHSGASAAVARLTP